MSPETIDRLACLMILDLLLQSQESHWLRRAEDFARVGTPNCDAIAKACRAKAALCREESADEWAEMLAVELGDAA